MQKSYTYGIKEYEDLSKVKTIYYLYLSGMFTFYISTLIGYAMAFGERKNRKNSIIAESHYEYLIKILHINALLNIVMILISATFMFIKISEVDFMNLDVESLTREVITVVSLWSIFSIIVTVIFYIQIWVGLKKANNIEQA